MFEVYFFIIFAYCLLIISLKLLRDYAFTLFSSFFMVVLSLYLFKEYSANQLFKSFALICLAIGLYTSLRGVVEFLSKPSENDKINLLEILKEKCQKKKQSKNNPKKEKQNK